MYIYTIIYTLYMYIQLYIPHIYYYTYHITIYHYQLFTSLPCTVSRICPDEKIPSSINGSQKYWPEFSDVTAKRLSVLVTEEDDTLLVTKG